MVDKALFTSDSDEWATPQELLDVLTQQFPFTLDVCATPENAKCERYFTKDDDGLAQSWQGHTCWMNPPYSAIGDWMRKAAEEGQKEETCVVCLIPSRTDTRYWHEHVMQADEIRFLRGRLKFGNSKNSAPFPSAVVIFRPPGWRLWGLEAPSVVGWDWKLDAKQLPLVAV